MKMQVAGGEGTADPPLNGSVDTSQEVLSGRVECQRNGDFEREGLRASMDAASSIEHRQGNSKTIGKTTSAPRDVELEWAVFPESNYSFEADSTLGNKWGSGSEEELLKKRQEAYFREGTRRSVAAIFLVHRAEYPHVLLLLDQQQKKHSLLMFKYKTWQKPREVLHAKLAKYLIRPEQCSKRKWVAQQLSNEGPDMEVGEFLGEWWRGEFDDELVPYLPPHVTRPKERVRVHQVGREVDGVRYEAETSMNHENEPTMEDATTNGHTNGVASRAEGAGSQVGAQPTLCREEELELLPPELQHLAELEEDN